MLARSPVIDSKVVDMTKRNCKYGESCYRKNPDHLRQFSHPWKEEVEIDDKADKESVEVSEEDVLGARSSEIEKLESDGVVTEEELKIEPETSGKRKRNDEDVRGVKKIAPELPNPLCYFLTKVKGIDAAFNNSYTANLKEILSEERGTLVESVQFNYMIDVDWLMNQYPKVFRECPLLLVAQDKQPTKDELKHTTAKYKNIKLAFARLMDSFGTHHTKMMILKYETGIRVVIHTANLIEIDWHQKTQGLWISPVFPLKDSPLKDESPTKFRTDLIEYLESYRTAALDRWIDLLKKTDMSDAKVFLIASTPGN